MQLNHLHLRVRDLARSQAFYERYLGMREHAKRDGVVFITDEMRFDLALSVPDDGGDIERLPEWFHFGFRQPTRDHVVRAFTDMTQGQVDILDRLEASDDYMFFRCADPDGYTIEIYWE